MSETFVFMNLEFDVTTAIDLAKEYPVHEVEPLPDYSPLITINRNHAMTTDLTKPIIFAEVVLGGQANHILIDGHHRNFKAYKEKKHSIPAVFLSIKDTLKIISAPPAILNKMKKEAKALGHDV